jgi:hypothetical protein
VDLEVVLKIPRPPAEVRAWWLDAPADYRASDPREQPHRIVTLRRDGRTWETLTYWRVPPLRNLRIPETFTFREDGWDVDVRLPFGLAQRDVFTLAPTPTGTRVTIQVTVRPRNLVGRLARPAFLRYARKSYPRAWRGAAKLCARDAPRLSPRSS